MRIKILLLFILISSVAIAQQADLESPRATYQTFYNNLQEGNLDITKASKVINSRHIFSRNKRIELVGDLRSYIDHKKFQINIDSIPGNNDYRDSVSNTAIFLVAEGISIEKYGKNWYLSKETVDAIPELIASTGEAAEDETLEEEPDVNLTRRKEQQAREVELAQIARMDVDLASP